MIESSSFVVGLLVEVTADETHAAISVANALRFAIQERVRSVTNVCGGGDRDYALVRNVIVTKAKAI